MNNHFAPKVSTQLITLARLWCNASYATYLRNDTDEFEPLKRLHLEEHMPYRRAGTFLANPSPGFTHQAVQLDGRRCSVLDFVG
jgi:hypothetical protein